MEIEPLEVLKWVGIVLAAGFIGYFGRYVAMLIIDRMHRKKSPQAYVREANKKVLARLNEKIAANQLKSEKKLAKIKAKRAKKVKKK
jgi:hypothetical protein